MKKELFMANREQIDCGLPWLHLLFYKIPLYKSNPSKTTATYHRITRINTFSPAEKVFASFVEFDEEKKITMR